MSGLVQETYTVAVGPMGAGTFPSLPGGIAKRLIVTTAFASGAVLTLAPRFTTNNTTDVTGGAETITRAGHGLVNGATLTVASTGALPSGLTANTLYYVVQATENTFKLSLTAGGAPVNIEPAATPAVLTWSMAVAVGNHSVGTQIPISCNAIAFGGAGAVVALA